MTIQRIFCQQRSIAGLAPEAVQLLRKIIDVKREGKSRVITGFRSGVGILVTGNK